MSVFLISIDAEESESWHYGDPSDRAGVENAFASLGAHVVRFWDRPYGLDRPWNWLVVTDLANPLESYDVLGRAGVEIGGVVPLRLDPQGAQSDMAIIEALPDRLTDEVAHSLYDYLAPGFGESAMAVGPGVVVWPCCQGVGEHLSGCKFG